MDEFSVLEILRRGETGWSILKMLTSLLHIMADEFQSTVESP